MYAGAIIGLDSESALCTGVRARRLMLQGVCAAERIVDALGLRAYYDFSLAKCSSNHLPYHNEYHTTCMLLNCYEGYLVSAGTLVRADHQALVLGALFHDADHSGGLSLDAVNIERAVDLLWQAHAYCMSSGGAVEVGVLICAVACVRATQYPHVAEPKNMLERIMRDADLMQVYEDDPSALLTQYQGLHAELEVRTGHSIAQEDFAEQCSAFIAGVSWYTDWAKEKAVLLGLVQRTGQLHALLCAPPTPQP